MRPQDLFGRSSSWWVGPGGAGSAHWLLLAIFPLQRLVAQSLQLVLGPQGGQGHRGGTEYSLRMPHTELLSCLGGIAKGPHCTQIWSGVKGRLWVGLNSSDV